MKIREAVKKDLPQLKKLFFEDQKYTKGFDEELVVNEQTKKEMEKDVNRIFKEPNNKIFVAEENGEITGFIIPTFSPGVTRSGWIGSIFINEPFRRKGTGSKLMEKGIEWLKQKRAKKVELTAYKVNQEALSFYKKHNFKKQPAKFVRLGKRIE
jgi:ribosomal protein S18 acetylase RimI-like enzyme